MHSAKKRLLLAASALFLVSLACTSFTDSSGPDTPTTEPTAIPPTSTPRPTPTQITLPDLLDVPGEANPEEPVFVFGDIPYTSPFFFTTLEEPFVLLEDQAGFVARDRNFVWPLASQAIGPVEVFDDESVAYSLPLPSVPQGTFVDVDNNGEEDQGVQVFAIAYWSNTWGGPFLEERDGTGWSTGYASTETDGDREGEIDGGLLLVWAPNDEQGFPTGFGTDNMLFTEDDPIAPIPAGYTYVNLDETPFLFYKESVAEIELIEGEGALNDYSDLDYGEAFEAMFAQVRQEYPFTEDKNIDWDALYAEFSPLFNDNINQARFSELLHDFSLRIPDGHVGMTFDGDLFVERNGGSFGLVLAELSDGRVIVTQIIPGAAGDNAGMVVGTEIIAIDDVSITEALDNTVSYFGPYSTPDADRQDRLIFVTRFPVGTRVDVEFRNPGDEAETVTLDADFEVESLFAALPDSNVDPIALPVEAFILEDSGLGFIRINSFLDDIHLTASLWERALETMIEEDVPGIIIDMRLNGGGSGGLARDFAGYFFTEEYEFSRRSYYNERTDQFEYLPQSSFVEPGPFTYDGRVAVLVGTNCVSACEGFSAAMAHDGRALIVGYFPTAGAFGEVGRGQYDLPGDISMQYPTGRPENADGTLLIEGTGVVPDVVVPITEESALGQVDAVLEAAVDALR